MRQGFSTMRLFTAAGCAAAEAPPPSAAEQAAGMHGDGPRGAFDARLAEALLASANAIEATPLADALGEEGAAASRLRAVVLPPGVDIAGGDGDPALRWAPPPPEPQAQP